MTKPSPIALVVCDNIYSESGGKTALVGLFNRITTQEFPAKHSRLCVYASVTDIRPNVKFKLDVVHSETDEMVVSLEGEPPNPGDLPSGCRFRTRCPMVRPECAESEPPLRSDWKDQDVACFFAE